MLDDLIFSFGFNILLSIYVVCKYPTLFSLQTMCKYKTYHKLLLDIYCYLGL